jgi:hypothetical protein
MTRVLRGNRLLVSVVALLAFNAVLLVAFASAGPHAEAGVLASWFVGDAILTLGALALLDRDP